MTTTQRQVISRQLTIQPQKVGDHPGEAPGTIRMWEETKTHIGVPREYFLSFLKPYHKVELAYTMGASLPSPIRFEGELRPEQRRAQGALLKALSDPYCTGGILRAAPGFGKTVSALSLASQLAVPILVVVHKEFLVEQWLERIRYFLPGVAVGRVQQDVCDFEGKHLAVGMVHSLAQREYPPALYQWPGALMVDESLPGYARILTSRGYRPIEEVVADPDPVYVLAYDRVGGRFAVKPVTRKWVHKPRSSMMWVRHECGTLVCTSNHVVFTPSGDRTAGELEPGNDYVIHCDVVSLAPMENRLTLARVLETADVETPELVYDLTVEDLHNFVAEGVVVHNCHRIGAETWAPVPACFPARWRIGLSVGPQSVVELRGGVFGLGWVGPIEAAFDEAVEYLPVRREGTYDVVRFDGVESRGWEGYGFCWKPVKSLIRHSVSAPLRCLRVSGRDLRVTDDHSLFRLEPGGFVRVNRNRKPLASLSVCRAKEVERGDRLPMDDGAAWGSRCSQGRVDVAAVAVRYGLRSVKVAVSLDGVARRDVGASPKSWWNYRNQGSRGHYLPAEVYLACREGLPEPSAVYTEGARGVSTDPYIDLRCWAYILGFWLGDGWVSGNRVNFAVELSRVPEILTRLRGLPGVVWHPRQRETPGASAEVRCSSAVVAAIFRDVFGSVGCGEKSIPAAWVVGWEECYRRELLQGLLDSDGCRSERESGRVGHRVRTTSPSLVRSLLSLLRSLGVVGGVSGHEPSLGGVVDSRQIMGRRRSFQVYWSGHSELSDDAGHRGHRRRFCEGELSYLEGVVRSVNYDRAPPDFVYDLEMGGHPSFVADGVLVHNSATPRRKDGADNVFRYSIGKVLYASKEKLLKVKVKRVWTDFQLFSTPSFDPSVAPRHLIIQFLTTNRARNRIVVAQIAAAAAAGRKLLVLSERLNHLELLHRGLLNACSKSSNGSRAPTVGYFVGGRTSDERAEAAQAQVVLATVQMAAEGLDIPPLDTLVLATPMWDVEQPTGRIQRICAGKKDPIVVDIRDDLVATFRRAAAQRDRFYLRVT